MEECHCGTTRDWPRTPSTQRPVPLLPPSENLRVFLPSRRTPWHGGKNRGLCRLLRSWSFFYTPVYTVLICVSEKDF